MIYDSTHCCHLDYFFQPFSQEDVTCAVRLAFKSQDIFVTHLSRHKNHSNPLSCEVSVLYESKFVQRVELQCGVCPQLSPISHKAERKNESEQDKRLNICSHRQKQRDEEKQRRIMKEREGSV